MSNSSIPLWLKILLSVVVIEVLGGLSGILTASSIRDWFETLTRPPGNPPNWVFGPVWTTLYALMGISFALVWHHGKGLDKRRAMTAFIVQFILNLAWTPIFFGAHQIGAALVVIIALLVVIFITIRRFFPIHPTAAWLLFPYLLWVTYATYLNTGFLVLNR